MAKGDSCLCGLLHLRAGSALPRGLRVPPLPGGGGGVVLPRRPPRAPLPPGLVLPLTDGEQTSPGAQKSATSSVSLFWGSTTPRVSRKYKEKEKHNKPLSPHLETGWMRVSLGRRFRAGAASASPGRLVKNTGFLGRPPPPGVYGSVGLGWGRARAFPMRPQVVLRLLPQGPHLGTLPWVRALRSAPSALASVCGQGRPCTGGVSSTLASARQRLQHPPPPTKYNHQKCLWMW